jgi:hypothetical protein
MPQIKITSSCKNTITFIRLYQLVVFKAHQVPWTVTWTCPNKLLPFSLRSATNYSEVHTPLPPETTLLYLYSTLLQTYFSTYLTYVTVLL